MPAIKPPLAMLAATIWSKFSQVMRKFAGVLPAKYAIIAQAIAVIFFFTGLLGTLLPNVGQGLRDFVGYFSTAQHMRDFSRGLIDSRPIIFYLTMTILLQVFTFQVFQYRKWKF